MQRTRTLLLTVLVALALAACASPLVGRTTVVGKDGSPIGVAAFDGRYVVAGGEVGIQAEIAEKNQGAVLGPINVPAGAWFAGDAKEGKSHSYKPGEPLPQWCAPLLTSELIKAFGLTFQ